MAVTDCQKKKSTKEVPDNGEDLKAILIRARCSLSMCRTHPGKPAWQETVSCANKCSSLGKDTDAFPAGNDLWLREKTERMI